MAYREKDNLRRRSLLFFDELKRSLAAKTGSTEQDLRQRVEAELTRVAAPHELHGTRTQEVFRELCIALGQFRVLKEEDSGACISTLGAVKVPDFRMILPDRRVLLIEVKNHHATHKGQFKVSGSYIEGLERYAAEMKAELRLAIHWSRIGLWTLLDPARLTSDPARGHRRISFGDAFKYNEMFVLGDRWLATKPPLAFRVWVTTEERVPTGRRTELRKLRITGVELRAGGKKLTTEAGQRLAWILFLHGRWQSSGWRLGKDGAEEFSELLAEPPSYAEVRTEDSLELVGPLSSIYSSQVLDRIGERLTIAGEDSPFHPGELSALVPKDFDFKRSELRLAVLEIHPPKSE